jgi:two-component system LytT family response regulator
MIKKVLINHGFFRVHNSHIVNKLHIKRYKKNDGGIVVMSDNAEIIIARRRKDDFLEWLKNDNYVPDIH